MKQWCALLAFCLMVSPVFAADLPASQKPVTANKVEGPVTGQLSDKITLTIQNPVNDSPQSVQ